MEWNRQQKSLSAEVLRRGCPGGSSGAGCSQSRKWLCLALGRCVWSFLNHPVLHGLSLGRNIARTGEETSEITVKYLKILGRKMLRYKSKSFLISVLIMQTSFFSSSYKVFYHLSWRSHCSLVSTGEITLLATLLSTCSWPGTMQRPKDTAAMTDTLLHAGLYI